MDAETQKLLDTLIHPQDELIEITITTQHKRFKDRKPKTATLNNDRILLSSLGIAIKNEILKSNL